MIYGLKETAKDGLGWLPVLFILVGMAIGAAFVRRQQRLANPLLDLGLFADRAFSTSLGTLTITVVFMLGTQFLIAQYMQMVLGLSPLQASLWGLPMVAGGTASIMVASALVGQVRRAYVFAAGLTIAAVGFAILTQVDATSAISTVVTGSVLLFIGLMPVSALGMDMIIGTTPGRA